jgi:outer membrane receptor protein involved in Fe transport
VIRRLLFLALWGLIPPLLQGQEETIIIAAEREAVTPVTLGPAVTVITREEIAVSGAVDTGQLLDHLAGLKTERTGGNLSPLRLSIRGSGAERILVLVDGEPLPGGDLSLIDPERIERIEILKGSSAAEGGSGALGGIVRIVTRQDIPENRFRADLRSSLGSLGYRDLSASLAGETGLMRPLSWRLGVSASAEDSLYGYSDDGDIVLRENAGGERYRFFGGLEWLIDPDREIGLRFRAEGSHTDRGAPGTADFPTIRARLTDSYLDGTLTGFWNGFPLFGIEGSVSGGWHHTTYKDPGYLLGEIDHFHEQISLSGNQTLFRRDEFKRWSLDSRLSGRFEYESLTSTALTGSNGTEGSGTPVRTAWSIILTEEVATGPLIFSPVARFDHAIIGSGGFSRTDSRFSFSAGLAWKPSETVTVKGRVASGYRLPAFADLFWPSTAFAVGNPSLEPEESLSYEVSLAAELVPGWFIELTHFNSLIDRMIQWNPGPGGTWRPENIGRAGLSGFEGETRASIPLAAIGSVLSLRGGYGLLFARDLTEGSSTYDKRLPRRPMEQASAGATLRFIKGHFLTAECRYTGYRYTNSQNTALVPSSFVADLTAGVTFAPGWELRLGIFNLLDTPYIDDLEYPVPGRTIRLTLLWSGGGR